MELRTLKYLLSLAETGSFTAAAGEHYVTQPAVSIQIRKLEEELGTPLLERRGRNVSFTGTGERVLRYARQFIRLERELYDEISDLEGLRSGSISLGTIDAAGIYVMPQIFAHFRELYPAVDIHLEIASTRPLLTGLSEGKLDLVVGTFSREEQDLDVFPFYSEKLVLIAPPGHPLAGESEVTVDQLSGYPFISFHSESVTRGIIEDFFKSRGVELRITMAMGSTEAIKNLVASGLGMALLPYRLVENEERAGDIVLLNVKGMNIRRELALFLMPTHYLPIAARAFLSVMSGGLGLNIPDKYKLDNSG